MQQINGYFNWTGDIEVSKEEIKERIEKRQSVLVSRCLVVESGTECGHIFVVNRKLMDNNKPRTDPRIVHLQDFHHLKDKHNKPVIRLDGYFENLIRVPGKFNGQKVVFFDELHVTEEQFNQLANCIKGWLH